MTRKMKDSGVEWIGEIPAEVDIINNKYLFKYIKGKNPKELNSDKNGLPYIGAGDLEMDGDNHIYENYSIEQLPTVEKDETLVLWDGARAGLIGVGHAGYIGSTIVKVIPRVDYIDKKFWYWYLKGFQPLLLDWVGGTTIPHMNRKFINDIKFVNFPLKQQKAIANFLDKKTQEIDNIISKTKKAIEEYKKYKQSLITETVTKGLDKNVEMKDSGIEWIGDIPKHWDVIKLKYLLSESLKYGANSSGCSFDENLPRYIRITDINKENELKDTEKLSIELNKNSGFILKEGDILFARSGATVGKTFFYKEEMGLSAFAGYLIRARISSNNLSEFVYYITLSSYYEKWKDSILIQATIENIGADKYNNLMITVPPMEEQKEILNYLNKKTSQIDHIISSKEKLLTEMESYKKSLIYETVTGKREVE